LEIGEKKNLNISKESITREGGEINRHDLSLSSAVHWRSWRGWGGGRGKNVGIVLTILVGEINWHWNWN
jgi:hypothetical protein